MDANYYEAKIIAQAQERGYSRTQLAVELGITTRTLASRLKGHSEWRLHELVTLAVLLDVPLLVLAADAVFFMAASNPDGTLSKRVKNIRWCLDCTGLYRVAPDSWYKLGGGE